VDRSIQATIEPGQVVLDYEVSLSELTLTQDLRALSGSMPGGDRDSWLARYAEVTGPLNAKGLLVVVDGRPFTLTLRGYDLAVEEHPRYLFHFRAEIPCRGRLSIRDRNYESSEGTSRLAVRGHRGVTVTGDDLPADVEQILVRPVWQLTDAEEKRTKQVVVDYECKANSPDSQPELPRVELAQPPEPGSTDAGLSRSSRLSELLNATSDTSWLIIGFVALALGAAHAIQPGHGKTLVTAAALGPQTRLYQPLLLALATTLTHAGSVLLVALALWVSGATRVATFHQGIARIAGFVIAAAGMYRLGRAFGGLSEQHSHARPANGLSTAEVLGLGAAGGLVPCWDAIGLLVLAAALGRLTEGIALVLAFSVGMALVLVAVGCVVWTFKSRMIGLDRLARWQKPVTVICGLMLTMIGLGLFLGN
jgi:ABC-type nickel/cobalt efflux system permease component RcnA